MFLTRDPRLRLPCLIPGCNRWFKNTTGLACHQRSKHGVDTDPQAVDDAADHTISSSSIGNHDIDPTVHFIPSLSNPI